MNFDLGVWFSVSVSVLFKISDLSIQCLGLESISRECGDKRGGLQWLASSIYTHIYTRIW